MYKGMTNMDDMTENEVLSIADFARLSRTSRSTLLYYDKIGLLSPVSRRENNYRDYTHAQLATVNQIRTCQALGMSLEDIRRIRKDQSPEIVDELFERQIKQIDGEIETWIRARKLLTTLKSVIHPLLTADIKTITVEYVPAVPIVLGGINDYSDNKNGFTALAHFYNYCSNKYPDLDLNYPVWAMLSEERLKNNDWELPDRFYFFNPDGYDKRPAAYYAIGYTRGGYGQCGDLYERLIAYINIKGYEICGPAYEEYPLNEICYSSDEDFLIRLMITVRKE